MNLEKIGNIGFIVCLSYVVILHILKLIYLLFKPKFLDPVRFGTPSKMMMTFYYLLVIYCMVVYVLRLAGVLEVVIR